MSYAVELARDAERYLRRQPPDQRRRIVEALRDLSDDPHAPPSKALRNGGGLRSLRVGGLRIVYVVQEDIARIDVRRIGPRGQVYRHLDE